MEDMIRKIKKIMIEVSTGETRIEDINDEYQILYEKLNKEYQNIGLKNPNAFSDLWEFYHFWKEHLPSYSSRRNYVIKMYKNKSAADSYADDFWYLINDRIKTISKSRFESGHYADSVEAAFKEINTRVKKTVKNTIGKELDGSPLMKTAFSANNPLIKLGDISTESGRNIQLGFMELFSGAMVGIRNPKAHANINITKEYAIHLLFVASLLMIKIDGAEEQGR
jgi:uncharacterized protein (TIGR02391 family)